MGVKPVLCPLSRCQWEIAYAAFGEGLSDSAIAERCGRSESNVRSHLCVAAKRVGVKGREGLRAWIERGGWFGAEAMPPVPTDCPLSQCQWEVFWLVLGEGMSDKQVALALGVKLQAVRMRFHNGHAKLGVPNRIEATKLMGARGWLGARNRTGAQPTARSVLLPAQRIYLDAFERFLHPASPGDAMRARATMRHHLTSVGLEAATRFGDSQPALDRVPDKLFAAVMAGPGR